MRNHSLVSYIFLLLELCRFQENFGAENLDTSRCIVSQFPVALLGSVIGGHDDLTDALQRPRRVKTNAQIIRGHAGQLINFLKKIIPARDPKQCQKKKKKTMKGRDTTGQSSHTSHNICNQFSGRIVLVLGNTE